MKEFKFLYVGMQDMEENRDPFLHDLNGDRELESRLRPLLGRNQAIRCLNYVNYLNELGVNPEFAYRDDLGHSTDPDVWAKFEKFISKIAKQ